MTDRKEHPETLCQAPTGLDDFDNKNIEISSIDSWIIEDEGCISSDDNGAWSSKQQAEYDAYLAKNRKILSGKAIIKHEKGNTRPKLLVDRANPDKTIEAFASIIAESGSFYDHNNEIVEVTLDRNTGLDIIRKVDAGLLVIEAHRRTRPYLIKYDNGTFERRTLSLLKNSRRCICRVDIINLCRLLKQSYPALYLAQMALLIALMVIIRRQAFISRVFPT